MIINKKRILTLFCAGLLFLESVGMTGVTACAAEAVSVNAAESYEEEWNDPLYHKLSQQVSLMSLEEDTESAVKHHEKFDEYKKVYGIDVSKYQKEIDWEAVKADGVEYAIIRLGYRGYVTPTLMTDDYFDVNMKGAHEAGIGIGIYFFTQATTVKEAKEEANYIIKELSSYPNYVSWPVIIDIEKQDGSRLDAANLSKAEKTKICEAFCKQIENAGYQAGVYSNADYLENELDAEKLSESYYIWLAHYTDETDYEGTYHMWQYSSDGAVDGITGRVDVNVAYEPDGYKITYHMDGGKNSSKNPLVYTGEETIVLDKPTRKGYTFQGWYTDEEYKNPITEITKGSRRDKVIYAKWTVNKYRIRFDGNGSTSGEMADKGGRSYGKTYKLPVNEYKRKGYTFAGWNTKPDGSGKSYSDKEKVKNLTSSAGKTVVLYAQWTANQYEIRFIGNGSTKGEVKPKACLYGKSYRLRTNKFKRTGYKFIGWNTKKDGSGKSYSNKEKIRNLTYKDGKTVKLYAQWKKK